MGLQLIQDGEVGLLGRTPVGRDVLRALGNSPPLNASELPAEVGVDAGEVLAGKRRRTAVGALPVSDAAEEAEGAPRSEAKRLGRFAERQFFQKLRAKLEAIQAGASVGSSAGLSGDCQSAKAAEFFTFSEKDLAHFSDGRSFTTAAAPLPSLSRIIPAVTGESAGNLATNLADLAVEPGVMWPASTTKLLELVEGEAALSTLEVEKEFALEEVSESVTELASLGTFIQPCVPSLADPFPLVSDLDVIPPALLVDYLTGLEQHYQAVELHLDCLHAHNRQLMHCVMIEPECIFRSDFLQIQVDFHQFITAFLALNETLELRLQSIVYQFPELLSVCQARHQLILESFKFALVSHAMFHPQFALTLLQTPHVNFLTLHELETLQQLYQPELYPHLDTICLQLQQGLANLLPAPVAVASALSTWGFFSANAAGVSRTVEHDSAMTPLYQDDCLLATGLSI